MVMIMEEGGGGSGSGSSSNSSPQTVVTRCSSSPPSPQGCFVLRPGIPYLLQSDDDGDNMTIKGSSDGGAEHMRITDDKSPQKGSVTAFYDADDSDIEMEEVTPEKVSIPAGLRDGTLWYACGGGWVVLLHPFNGYAIKLFNILTNKEISDFPYLNPSVFLYEHVSRVYDALELEDFDKPIGCQLTYFTEIRRVAIYESMLAKFILDGDPPENHHLVALFGNDFSCLIQAAFLFEASWVPIVNYANPGMQFLDGVVHSGCLWAIDKMMLLSAFPLHLQPDGHGFVRAVKTFQLNLESSPTPIQILKYRYYVLPCHEEESDHPSSTIKFFAVKRTGFNSCVNPQPRASFRVYELSITLSDTRSDDNLSERELTKEGLGNRALLVGDNASFSLGVEGGNDSASASASASASPKANCIYFSDHFGDCRLLVPVGAGVYDLDTHESKTLVVPHAASAPYHFTTTDAADAPYRPSLLPPMPQWISF